ncbi:glycoside hydrolase family 16 protein [Pseudonocardia sp. K10HN5]|uniref:Glycoside hydrolase family 16 protein n=2 Tax=Pseudonocardia acidicola TaxID=2724939 RepID=A0ABX1SGE0_9PSEU|nr:glycoside hydrolase family 16 protein [Pseudonocardia acidicola]
MFAPPAAASPLVNDAVPAELAAALSLTGFSLAATPGTDASCTWRLSAVRLYQELTGINNPRAVQLRALLADSGVDQPGFLPDQCRSGSTGAAGSGAGTAGSPGNRSSGSSPSGPSGPSAAGPGSVGAGSSSGPTGPGTGSSSTGSGTTAAETLGWGTPDRTSDFTTGAGTNGWSLYDGPGHAGNGRRSPSAVSLLNGLLTISGDSGGTSEGMAWTPGQKYGRWEARVKSPASAAAYHSLLLLWPDAENFPVGGEIDFMEIGDPTRQKTDMFLHYGADNSQLHGQLQIDATQWHNWALEWTPNKITAFVDGKPWWSTTDTFTFPPGPMHLCIQLDYFPGDGSAAGGGQEHVAWVKQYPLNSGGSSGSSSNGNSAPGSAGPSGSSPGGSASSGSSAS